MGSGTDQSDGLGMLDSDDGSVSPQGLLYNESIWLFSTLITYTLIDSIGQLTIFIWEYWPQIIKIAEVNFCIYVCIMTGFENVHSSHIWFCSFVAT